MNTNLSVEYVLTKKIKNNLTIKELVYDTTLEINLHHLVSNLNYFRSLLKPQTKIMAMVKAFSYGLGTYEVAKVLEENNVHYLGVANIYEGIELRKAGINMPIMVMKPEIESFDLIIQYHLSPTIFSFHALEYLIQALKNSSFTIENPFLINLKIDTGMHRLGFEMDEVPDLLKALKNYPFLRIESIFSHLAASEDKEHDSFTNNQLKSFKTIAQMISNEFDYHIDQHILNSNGIIRFNANQLDMVRLGIGLYGEADNKKLHPVSTLKSKIAQIKNIPKGDTIGYNRKGVAFKNLKIATIPVGYADGLNRKLGNGNWNVIINGQKAAIIGNVCMDMVMLNVTEIDCSEGDEVFIFSSENPISKMAQQINTTPYEILTSYSPRVKRVFKY